MSGEKFFIDTDIGDDIDDAVALYAAMKLGIDIVGISTVFRNTRERAGIAKKLLRSFGGGYENVPVLAGFGLPIAAPVVASVAAPVVASDTAPVAAPEPAPGFDIGHVPHYSGELSDPLCAPDCSDPGEAVSALLRACQEYGDSLTVIAIGPFTNIARAAMSDPDTMRRTRVVAMGGAFFKQYADWNVMCDVEAAKLMFSSVPKLECVGADVTHLLTARAELSDRLMFHPDGTPAAQYIAKLCALWQLDRPGLPMILHDALAVCYARDTSLCGMEPIDVSVVTDGFARGMTLNVGAYGKRSMNPSPYLFCPPARCLAARTVDIDSFYSQLRLI